jgi:hypothetical protein
MGNGESTATEFARAKFRVSIAIAEMEQERQQAAMRAATFRREARRYMYQNATLEAKSSIRMSVNMHISEQKIVSRQHQMMQVQNTLAQAKSVESMARAMKSSAKAMKALSKGIASEKKVKGFLAMFKKSEESLLKSADLLSDGIGEGPAADKSYKDAIDDVMKQIQDEMAIEQAQQMPNVPLGIGAVVEVQLKHIGAQLAKEQPPDPVLDAEDADLQLRLERLGRRPGPGPGDDPSSGSGSGSGSGGGSKELVLASVASHAI